MKKPRMERKNFRKERCEWEQKVTERETKIVKQIFRRKYIYKEREREWERRREEKI